ncbi:hypothetical protein PUN28_005962 [Cardiocondyla obscurior]|uniref:Secreted protein n=1 Tax=Cardiocondyla obscurior TaxID=286306 RepID=A0AAW2GBD1_9HYME
MTRHTTAISVIATFSSMTSTPWGMIGVVYDPGYNVCACSRPRYACARVPVSITSHLSRSVHPSVCLSVDRSVGSPPAAPASAKKSEGER